MASVRATLRALVHEHRRAKILLERLSSAISTDLQHGRFITMVLAVLDPCTHRLEFTNAGLASAIVYRAATESFYPLPTTGVPLGILD